jgi:hypothetical protein
VRESSKRGKVWKNPARWREVQATVRTCFGGATVGFHERSPLKIRRQQESIYIFLFTWFLRGRNEDLAEKSERRRREENNVIICCNIRPPYNGCCTPVASSFPLLFAT